MQFMILGPLEVYDNDVSVALGSYKQRVLLAALLCRANTVMPIAELLAAIWGDKQPRTAHKNLQVYISALRKFTGDRIRRVSYGYTLKVPVDESDLLSFDSLAAAGRKASYAGDLEGSGALLGEALRLWRDQPLADLRANSFLRTESASLTQRYLAVYEDWVDLEIRAGRHLGVIDRLRQLVQLHPFRERLVLALMTGLGKGGNHKEALAHYEEHRQLMARELGLEPSPLLQRHYQSILTGEPAPWTGRTTVSGRLVAKPAQLPRDLSRFVGRAEQTEMLVRSLSDVDVAVISGYAGVGKTALAVHVGHLMARQFPDGQIFVTLRNEAGAPRAWRDLLGELMSATGWQTPLPTDEAAALGLWRSWVASGRFFLVLDDARDEASVRRLLPGRGASRTIVTSCWTLGGLDSPCRLQLGDLSQAEAFELLERTLGKARMLHAADAVGHLIARYGGQPLAIRVIAAKLAVLSHLSVRSYVDHLDQATDLLKELAIGDLSVRSRLERFHVGLMPRQREVFRALGVLPTPAFSYRDAAAALSELTAPADSLLEELMDANLVAPLREGGRGSTDHFVMSSLLHRYATTLYQTATRCLAATPSA